MLEGVAHWRPLLNGDSGFVPRPYTRAMELLEEPGEEAWRFLRAVGVTEVVSRNEVPLPLVARFGEERVASVPPGPEAEVVAAGRRVEAEGGVIDLGRITAVAGIGFELGEMFVPYGRIPSLDPLERGEAVPEMAGETCAEPPERARIRRGSSRCSSAISRRIARPAPRSR